MVFVMILLGVVDCKGYGCQWLDVSAYFCKNMAVVASRPCNMYIINEIKNNNYNTQEFSW